MSVKYRNASGQEVIVSGLTPGGELAYGTSTTRSGTFSITFDGSATGEGNVAVTFSEPMPDADYQVDFSYNGQWTGAALYANQKTANGFNVCYANIVSSTATRIYNYKAYKLYEIQHAQENAEALSEIQAAMPTGAGSGNKLTTKSYVDNADTSLETRLDAVEDLIPSGASISNQLVTASQASVDDALSTTSEHAVQNKVVKAALDDKQDTLTFDNAPTLNSNNPVKSGGVYSSEQAIYKLNSQVGAKNLIPYPYNSGNFTTNGITFTDNGDGTVLANGTAGSSSARFFCTPFRNYYLKAGNYILSDGRASHKSSVYLQVYDSVSPYTSRAATWGGDNVSFSLTQDTEVVVQININPGTVVANDLFKPMIRLASDPDDTYLSYSITNQQLTSGKANLSTVSQFGVKNLINVINSSQTISNIEFTVNDDNSVTVNGTASSYVGFYLGKANLEAGNYILSLNDDIQVGLGVRNKANNAWTSLVSSDTAHGYSKMFTITEAEAGEHAVYLYVESYAPGGDNVTAYPMIRLADDPDDTYRPFAMTNRELTSRIKTVKYTMPGDTDSHFYDLPSGFTRTNCLLLGAKCYTKYNSYVDISYGDINNTPYWGSLIYTGNNASQFQFTLYNATNTTSIEFVFFKMY